MPRFSQISEQRLAGCHPALQKLMHHAIRAIDFSVLDQGGWRSPEQQLVLYDLGKTKVLRSKHNHTHEGKPWSLAVDIAPYPVDFGQTPKQILKTYVDTRMTARTFATLEQQFIRSAKNQARFYFLAGMIKERADQLNIRIKWGGDWDSDLDFFDQTFDDLVHYELVGYENRPYDIGELL